MPEVNKILVAICFSDYCPATFRYATRLALQLHADLAAVNVIDIKSVQAVGKIEAMGYAVHAKDYVEGMIGERTEMFQQMIADSGFPEDRIKIVFKIGHPFEELIKVVKEEDVDLVVMGPKGTSDHPHLLVGGVAEKMLRYCPVSVTFYRKKQPQEE
ncbi:MAG: universal stress protein [Desulforhabdus sp.]|jgi:nucleotide-binding universal stress UspA family protein|nr:universal stress protein [Desulforhabdus sp.]